VSLSIHPARVIWLAVVSLRTPAGKEFYVSLGDFTYPACFMSLCPMEIPYFLPPPLYKRLVFDDILIFRYFNKGSDSLGNFSID